MIGFTKKVAWANRRDLPTVSAVYAFAREHETLLYIGSSRNLQARMAAHHRQKMLTDADEVHWLEEDESMIRSLEQALIEQHAPPWNGAVIPRELQAWNIRPISVKLSDAEKEKLEAAAAARGWNVSQLIRDFIWQLPEKPA